MALSTAIAVSSPGDPDYAAATAAFNLLHPPAPARTVIARSTADVVDAVTFARENGHPVSVIATGHSSSTAQPMDDGLLIRTEFTALPTIDPVRRTARIPAGTRWDSVVAAAAEHRLAALHGSSGTVGALGYLLRGGISFYGRAFGVASNSILSITLVTADSRTRTVNATDDPELFWALRGGGGGFGIVTEIEIQLYPMWNVLTGITIWDSQFADLIAPRWLEWTKTAPREVSTSLRIMNVPPLPGIPDVIAGRQVIALDGAVTIQNEDELIDMLEIGEDLLAPLRGVVEPIIDTWDVRSPALLPLTHMDPAEAIPYVGDSFLVKDVAPTDLSILLREVGPGSSSQLTAAEFRQLGGAFTEAEEGGGAFDRTDADLILVMVGAVGGPVTEEHNESTMAAVRQALAHLDTGYTVPTFVESTTQPARTFDDDTAERVDLVRDRVDPHGLFRLGVSRIVE